MTECMTVSLGDLDVKKFVNHCLQCLPQVHSVISTHSVLLLSVSAFALIYIQLECNLDNNFIFLMEEIRHQKWISVKYSQQQTGETKYSRSVKISLVTQTSLAVLRWLCNEIRLCHKTKHYCCSTSIFTFILTLTYCRIHLCLPTMI